MVAVEEPLLQRGCALQLTFILQEMGTLADEPVFNKTQVRYTATVTLFLVRQYRSWLGCIFLHLRLQSLKYYNGK